MTIRAPIVVGLAAVLIRSCGAETATGGSWPDAFVARLETFALIETLDADLLAGRSATATLEKWCADHRMAEQPKIVARREIPADRSASAETRRRLRLAEGEPLRYRRVLLVCGDHVLSEADNWYAPARLTDEMNRLLDETDTPFGKVVQDLHPFRRTFEAKLLWSPLPSGWEMTGPTAGRDDGAAADSFAIPRELFEHRALLYTEDQLPFSEVDETYLSGILEFNFARPQ
jgi:hypothetical protein